MLEVQPKDSRGYFILPQAPEDAGYYVYGTPGGGAAQYAHPRMLTLIFAVEREWEAIDDRKFGVGNISMANGVKFDHASHLSGLEVDIRPLRKDGRQVPVTYLDDEYDLDATETLINLFRANAPGSLTIFFNDNRIVAATRLKKHDNHFHVQFN
ncbi:penicillin-insensitive murein endopeptidase [Rugamonas sp. DEMB1]|uniref:penicillin-insensitive murein endopeptidase n=1 Tax=Rugamonas sp. DEMB1 TaxID=3039386 RepID=UPI00244B17B2|nr:penicillin-insensitive murein endopeptidase [Rugamonas sp. DEMB1]WGG48516.1 penicillin-insensitive murein endopeptidase [Rugamonas sp. DEMB1]